MIEYEKHKKISELAELFNKKNCMPEKRIEALINSGTTIPQISNQNYLKLLTRKISNPNEFLKKYEELKSAGIQNLDSIVYLLTQINKNKDFKVGLEKHAKLKSEERRKNLQYSLSDGTKTIGQAKLLSSEAICKLRDRLKSEKERLGCEEYNSYNKINKYHMSVINVPSWLKERVNLSWDYNVSDENYIDNNLKSIPYSSQEYALIEDILSVLTGVNGEYIHPYKISNKFSIQNFLIVDSVDRSFKEQIKRILVLCSYYSMLVCFIEDKIQFEAGQVNQALSAAMSLLLKDYFILISQLEIEHLNGRLTLQRLWFYLQKTLRTFSLLNNVAENIFKQNAFGGQVISFLQEKLLQVSGCTQEQDIISFLLQYACKPYMCILQRWIYQGVIQDPYKEFLVQDNCMEKPPPITQQQYYTDDYWSKRYSLHRERIPTFLYDLSQKILRTGKYLNVMRQCGEVIEFIQAKELHYSTNDQSYAIAIDEAYNFASQALLQLLLCDRDLLGQLKSVRRYLLLAQGDFIVQFMDSAHHELQLKIADIIETRLVSLLELALRTSAANSDPYKDEVGICLLPYDLESQMLRIINIQTQDEKECHQSIENLDLPGWEALAFNFHVSWPVSLVLNSRAVSCYQMLFRHLFYCKHVEQLLSHMWMVSKMAKHYSLDAIKNYGPAFALRQRMLNYVQNLEYYMAFEVLEPNWQQFVEQLNKVSSVDEVLDLHNDFLNTCLKDCMLTNPKLLYLVRKLLKACIDFTTRIQVIWDLSIIPFNMEESQFRMSMPTIVEHEEILNLDDTVLEFDELFSDILINLLMLITDIGRENYNDKLTNMLYRLDFNSYYASKISEHKQKDVDDACISSLPLLSETRV